jgi:hypothetical protein
MNIAINILKSIGIFLAALAGVVVTAMGTVDFCEYAKRVFGF